MIDRLLIILIALVACALSFHLGASSATSSVAAPPLQSAPAQLHISEIASLPQQSEARKLDDWRSLVNLAPRTDHGGQRKFIDLVRVEAERSALPAEVADAVAYVESGYNPSRIGDVGEIGLMQIRPTTAYMLGFRGSDAELLEPSTNIRYGVLYLAQAWRLAEGDLCRALMKYRAGHGAEYMTLRSVQYCSRARAYLESMQSPLARRAEPALAKTAAKLAPPNPAAATPAPTVRLALKARKLGGPDRFWAIHEARIRILTAKVHAKWRRFGQQKRRIT